MNGTCKKNFDLVLPARERERENHCRERGNAVNFMYLAIDNAFCAFLFIFSVLKTFCFVCFFAVVFFPFAIWRQCHCHGSAHRESLSEMSHGNYTSKWTIENSLFWVLFCLLFWQMHFVCALRSFFIEMHRFQWFLLAWTGMSYIRLNWNGNHQKNRHVHVNKQTHKIHIYALLYLIRSEIRDFKMLRMWLWKKQNKREHFCSSFILRH